MDRRYGDEILCSSFLFPPVCYKFVQGGLDGECLDPFGRMASPLISETQRLGNGCCLALSLMIARKDNI